MNKNFPTKLFGLNFRKVKKITYIAFFLPFNEIFVHTYFFKIYNLIRSISNHFIGNCTIITIPRIGISTILFVIHLSREHVDGNGKDCSKIVLYVINAIIFFGCGSQNPYIGDFYLHINIVLSRSTERDHFSLAHLKSLTLRASRRIDLVTSQYQGTLKMRNQPLELTL